MLTKDQKFLLAELIFERRATLFAPFSALVTKRLKQDKWEEIRIELNKATRQKHERGEADVEEEIPDIRVIRDIHWSNLRRSTLKKLASSSATGIGDDHHHHHQLTELDEMVLRIIQQGPTSIKASELPERKIKIEKSGINKGQPSYQPSYVWPNSSGEAKKCCCSAESDNETKVLTKRKLRLEIVKLRLEIQEIKRRKMMNENKEQGTLGH